MAALLVIERPGVVPRDGNAQGTVADEAGDVLYGVRGLDRFGIAIEVAPLDVRQPGAEIGDVVIMERAVLRRYREGRETAVTSHFRGHALADLVDAGGAAEQGDVRVGVYVDKARSDREPAGVYLGPSPVVV